MSKLSKNQRLEEFSHKKPISMVRIHKMNWFTSREELALLRIWYTNPYNPYLRWNIKSRNLLRRNQSINSLFAHLLKSSQLRSILSKLKLMACQFLSKKKFMTSVTQSKMMRRSMTKTVQWIMTSQTSKLLSRMRKWANNGDLFWYLNS